MSEHEELSEFLHERFAAEWEPHWADMDEQEQADSEYADIAAALVEGGYSKLRTVTTREEFAMVGKISGRHISILKSEAERIAAKGGDSVVIRVISEWEPFTPTPAGSET